MNKPLLGYAEFYVDVLDVFMFFHISRQTWIVCVKRNVWA